MSEVRALDPAPRRTLLLIGDEPAQTRLVTDRASRAGWHTVIFTRMSQAFAALDGMPRLNVSAVIVDENAIGDKMCEAIAALKTHLPRASILVASANPSQTLPAEVLRAGARDCLKKPIEIEPLLRALRMAASVTGNEEQAELQAFAERSSGPVDFSSMVGVDPAFRKALAQAATAARGHGNVLVEGEAGTGKDMLLRAMLAASPRARMPARHINARGQSADALMSVLFGHRKDAFPGAFESRTGLLQECEGGTLLLDEINRLPQPVQERLGEALNDRRIQPIGAAYAFQSDVRVLSASNQPLGLMVDGGKFDAMLYSAVSTTSIRLPPLRERPTDIPLLACYFISQFARQAGLRRFALTDDAVALLCAFDWPGNIRQFQSVLFRAAISCQALALSAEDFEPVLMKVTEEGMRTLFPPRSPAGGVPLYDENGDLRHLRDIEADIIRLAIGHYSGRMTDVARKLGIGRSTLYRKLTDLGIDSAQH